MFQSALIFFRFYLFWMAFFFIDRLVFLVWFWNSLKKHPFGEIIASCWHALSLDSSMAAYLSVIPLLAYLILMFTKIKVSALPLRIYVITLIVAFSIISGFNANIYREWGSKLNYRALDMGFNSTHEALASISSSPVTISLLTIAFLIIVGVGLSFLIIDYRVADREKPLAYRLPAVVLSLAVLVLVIRGGWQLTPINQSMAYYSTEPILNAAAVNTEWNLMQDILNNKYGNENPYKYYSPEEAQRIVDSLFVKPDSSGISVLNTAQPNVVIILVESLTAELIGSLGGEPNVTPNINRLSKEALLFTDIYAAAGRTDKGLVATLSGFPSQAVRSIMKQNDKQEKLPGLAQDFLKNGYHTSFYYGGESEFFNMKSYILSHGYQTLVDQYAFDKKDMNSKWGTFDHKVFEKQLADLDKVPSPFFSTLLTLSNHEPFELPGTAKFPGDPVENKFRSTTFYTDSCVGAYLDVAKRKPWYKNTLFVVLADHSHRLPGNVNEFDPIRYRIPLLFLGGALKDEFRGKRIDRTGNQTDLAATLFEQLGFDHSRYKWSKDMLNPKTPEFAFFNWDNGFAFGTGGQIVSFDNVGKNVLMRKQPDDLSRDEPLIRAGKAYMQMVFEEYLRY